MTRDGSVDSVTRLIDQPPTSRQSWSAVTAVAVLVLAFGVLVPFAGEPLPTLSGFIPATDAMIFVTDFITSVLLFSHFSIYPSRGYLFTALIVIPHALCFLGAFPPFENFGGGPQTSLRLYLIWHLALPAALLVYVWLNYKIGTNATTRLSTLSAIGLSAASVLGLVCGFVWIDIAGDKSLPSLYVGDQNEPGPLLPWVTPFAMSVRPAHRFCGYGHPRATLN